MTGKTPMLATATVASGRTCRGVMMRETYKVLASLIVCSLLLAAGATSTCEAVERGWSSLPLAAETSLAGELAGTVTEFQISPSGGLAVFKADKEVLTVHELYSVPVAGGETTKLNHPLENSEDVYEDVYDFKISPDGSAVAFKILRTVDDGVSMVQTAALYSVPISGGEVTLLIDLPDSIFLDYEISPDGQWVLYRTGTGYNHELYIVPTGGTVSTKLNQEGEAHIAEFRITDDSAFVVYGTQYPPEYLTLLYSVPTAGGSPVLLNPPTGFGVTDPFATAGDWTYFRSRTDDYPDNWHLYRVPNAGGTAIRLSPDMGPLQHVFSFRVYSDYVVYRADQDAYHVYELYSVPVGGGTSVKLNGTLAAGGDVADDYSVNSDETTVVYRADQVINEIFELFRVPITGGTAAKLSAFPAFGGDVLDFAVLEGPVAFRGDLETNNVVEVFSRPFEGGVRVKLNGTLIEGGDVQSFRITANGLLAYLADQDTDAVDELYGVTLAGIGPVTKLNGPLVSGGDVLSDYAFALPYVVYRADHDVDDKEELYSVLLDTDSDGDGAIDGQDCIAFDEQTWALPQPITDLMLSHTVDPEGTTTLTWTPPGDVGGNWVIYDVLRSLQVADFVSSPACVETNDDVDTMATDQEDPTSGDVFYYLVRGDNACGGNAGTDSQGGARPTYDCTNE